jgi:CheY-like chemotaxis protein
MSLVGNLEDLSLGDILQIVSLSRKSGVLSLSSRGREGKVVFRDGQVIRATSTIFRENIGDLLVRKSLVDMETLKKAVSIQKNSDPPPRLGDIIAEHFGVSKDSIEQAVKEQVERIVYNFFAWTEGTFSFELGEPSEMGATTLNPLQFMLDQGLNPQWLAMEGSRILDERRHRGESLEEEVSESVVDLESLLEAEEGVSGDGGEELVENPPAVESGQSAPAAEQSGRQVILVDDDPPTAEGIGCALGKLGYAVSIFHEGKEFLAAVEAAAAAGEAPALLIDLIMPRLNGTGILGGIELLQNVHERFPQFVAFVMSDHSNIEAEVKVRQFGVPAVLPKPKKNEVRDERGLGPLQAFAETLSVFLGDASEREVPAESAATYNWGAELLKEMGEETTADRQGKGPESPGLHLLKGMLQELHNPSLGGGIILLVLRFASELMNRAVIFLVKEKEIVGLGQFGIELSGEMADVRVRRMKIPRGEESIFNQVITEKSARRVRLGDSRWDLYLKEQLGGEEPEEIFLGPIISEGQVVAVLYGDNLPEKMPIIDTESLEIFLSQAGLAMEKALLERRLRGNVAI